ncbi:nucleoside phosphorylase [Patescibacteria group bacterium]|nr:nucleoside phosphorylase [Patescibacteria group bacterium]MBU1705547.1 nucleoside phosphorylase [Patescibacteria group bacterium]
MGDTMQADKPMHEDGRTYHLETRSGDLAARCLLVGSPERAQMIAETLFKEAKLMGDHRGLRSYTGEFNGLSLSVVTTGMGSASIGIVLPEAVASGARAFVRVGTCGFLQKEGQIGDAGIFTGAVRLDGASENWAPIEYPAVADYRLVYALVKAAEKSNHPYHVGIGATTTCFNEGQGRPDKNGYLPERLRLQHEELVARGVKFYSMEEATLFVWCSTHGGYPAAAVDAVINNRQTNEFRVAGEMAAAEIACWALAGFDL